jgi:hypothetical protein
MSATEARIVALEARLAAVEARLAGGGGASATGSTAEGAVASARELDGEWGDPVVKKDPKRWLEQGGDPYAGCHMSECPSDYLRILASLFDWMASKDEEQGKTYTNKKGENVPTAPLNRRSAAKARGWAERNAGKTHETPPPPHPPSGARVADDNDIPF